MRFISIAMVTLLLTATACSESTKTNSPEYPELSASTTQSSIDADYSSFEDLSQTITTIYHEHKSEVADMIRDIRNNSFEGYSDDALFTLQNCGPASIAFQKILIDHNIWAEVRTDTGLYKSHEYLLLRSLMPNGRYIFAIIDLTYRQYLTGYANRYFDQIGASTSQLEIANFLSTAQAGAYIPEPMIVPDSRYIAKFYSDAYASLANSPYALTESYSPAAPLSCYEMVPYPAPSRQMIYTRYLSTTQIETLKSKAEANKNEFTSTYPTVYAKGEWNSWKLNPDNEYYGTGPYSDSFCIMAPVDDYVWEIRIQSYSNSSYQFKFDIYNNWSLNFGDNNGDFRVDQNGSNIPTAITDYIQTITYNDRTGEYRIFSGSETGSYSFYNTVYLRGTFNNFAAMPMTLSSDFLWTTDATFATGTQERFKFDVYGDWSFNFGDNDSDGFGDENGNDIYISGGKKYSIYFDDRSKRYWYTEKTN